MPAGMELFPASDDSAWELIKDVINSSDYYVVVIGGRYGSMDEEGISYTEKEYQYAYSTGKPIIPILHKNPDNLPREKTETDNKAWEKLQEFRSKIEDAHTCKYWETAEGLKAKVIVSLTSESKKNPGIGWVRADTVPSEDLRPKIYDLKDEIQELENELKKSKASAPTDIENLQQGDDTIKLYVGFKATPYGGSFRDRKSYKGNLEPTWNEIFAGIAPIMINESTERNLRRNLKQHLSQIALSLFSKKKKFDEHKLSNFSFKKEEIDTCLVQLRALNLIEESTKKRSVKDTSTYWTLTSYGDKQMMKLRALKKETSNFDPIDSEEEKIN